MATRRPLIVAVAATVALASPARADCRGGWSTRAPMGTSRQELGVAAIGSVLYAVGGFEAGVPTAAAEAYDSVADRWRPIAALPVAVHHVGAAAVGGKLYAIGGLEGAAASATDGVYEYDPMGDAWRPRASLPAPRGAMGVAVLDDRIYVAGGLRGGASVADFAAYDPATDRWSVLPPMPTARNHLAAAAIGGRFYAVGGRDGSRLFGALEAFDPAAGAWLTGLAPLPTPRGGLMAAALGNRLFAFGGEGNPASPRGVFPQTEAYDVATDRWTTLEPMPTPRHGTVAAAIGDAIYLAGGASHEGFGVSGVTEVFVPPRGEALAITRARLRDRRLRLRGRFRGAAMDPAAVPVSLSIAGDAGEEIASLSIPPGGLTRRGRRLVYRAPGASAGIVRLVVRQHRRGVTLRAAAAATAAGEITVTLMLGETLFCGTARVRA